VLACVLRANIPSSSVGRSMSAEDAEIAEIEARRTYLEPSHHEHYRGGTGDDTPYDGKVCKKTHGHGGSSASWHAPQSASCSPFAASSDIERVARRKPRAPRERPPLDGSPVHGCSSW
jgi:hypothetical protein